MPGGILFVLIRCRFSCVDAFPSFSFPRPVQPLLLYGNAGGGGDGVQEGEFIVVCVWLVERWVLLVLLVLEVEWGFGRRRSRD